MPRHKDQIDKTAPGTLHEITRELLRSDEQTIFDVAVNTGLTPGWLAAFSRGAMNNPSCSKVQQLYEYLTGQPLKIR